MTRELENAILDRLTAAIQDTAFLPGVWITAASRFAEDLDLDGVEMAEVVERIEAVFDTKFPSEAVSQFQSVNDVVHILSRRFFRDDADFTFTNHRAAVPQQEPAYVVL